MFLLNGIPGTGKTYYIRNLINKLGDAKEFIWIPSYLIQSLANPNFLTFLLDHQNSVLIVEDAEQLLNKSNNERTAAVSNLLNITDGLLADALKIQIICTYNSNKDIIDDALFRKGRLSLEYAFEKLETTKAIKLSKSLGHNIKYTQPIELSEIYNAEVKNRVGVKKRNKIGYGN